MTFRLREKVDAVEALEAEPRRAAALASGKEIVSETVLYAIGRQGDTEALGLESAGLEADKRGRITVDERPPDGRAAHLRGRRRGGRPASPPRRWSRAGSRRCTRSASRSQTLPELVPTGVYAIPEIAMVGRTEEQLTDDAVPYVTGIARWSELARGADDAATRTGCSSCSSPPTTAACSACT